MTYGFFSSHENLRYAGGAWDNEWINECTTGYGEFCYTHFQFPEAKSFSFQEDAAITPL